MSSIYNIDLILLEKIKEYDLKYVFFIVKGTIRIGYPQYAFCVNQNDEIKVLYINSEDVRLLAYQQFLDNNWDDFEKSVNISLE